MGKSYFKYIKALLLKLILKNQNSKLIFNKFHSQ